MSICPPIPEIRLFDLEHSRPRSWVWSKRKVTKLDQYPIDFASFSFYINQTNNSWNRNISNSTLKNLMWRSWVRAKVKFTQLTQYPTGALPFHLTSITPTTLEIWPIVFELENTHPKFKKKITKTKACCRILPNSIRWQAWPREYNCQVLLWLNEWFSLYNTDKQSFAHQSHSCDLRSSSQKDHPVHFPRPKLSLSQICKV